MRSPRPSLWSTSNIVPTIIGNYDQWDRWKVLSSLLCGGFDIGNHVCQFMCDYKSLKEWPFFQVNFNLYPNKNEQSTFLYAYIDATVAAQQESSTTQVEINWEELLQQLMKEANYFTLASHFFWTLWAIHIATSTTIKFGYMVRERESEGKELHESLLGICPGSIDGILTHTWSSVWWWWDAAAIQRRSR